MIAKEVENRKKSSSKAGRVGGLAKYICNPETENSSEKCTYSNTLGFISKTQSGQIAEMISLSQEAVRSNDPIKHYILSWKEGEHPSNNQLDDSVRILLKETGLERHQVIYGLHQDTDNIHLHVMINRVHPHTQKLIEINNGFDIEPIHKALALIEHKQGWSREANGRYFVLENGDVCRTYFEAEISRTPRQKQRDREYKTGEKSVQRLAIEVAAPIIKNANTWEQLHYELAQHGVIYQPGGKGAVVTIAGINTKASALGSEAGFPKLQMRLGVYQPPIHSMEQSANILQPLSEDTDGWDAYLIHKKDYEEAKSRKNQIRNRHRDEMHALKNHQSNDRNDILSFNWAGKLDRLNALRRVMSEDHKEAQKALRAQQKEELRLLSVTFPEWPEWKQSKGQIKVVSQPESESRTTVQVTMVDATEIQILYSAEPSERQKEFKRYFRALRADRYRVTSTRLFKDGSREILILGDGEEGVRGYNAQEILNNESAVQWLEKRGHILEYTPISESRHHILIDKISHEGLDKLLHDGYTPAVVLESQPGQFQTIIIIQKSGTPFDDQICHRLSQSLNKEYGNPGRELVGAVHPHAAPGYEVCIPENSNNVTGSHIVTLIKSEYCECAKTQQRATEILEKLQPRQDAGSDESKLMGMQPAKMELEVDKKGADGFSLNRGKLAEIERSLDPEQGKPKNSGPSM